MDGVSFVTPNDTDQGQDEHYSLGEESYHRQQGDVFDVIFVIT